MNVSRESREQIEFVSAKEEYELLMKFKDKFFEKESKLIDKLAKATLDFLKYEKILSQCGWSVIQPMLNSKGLSIKADKPAKEFSGLELILDGKSTEHIYLCDTYSNSIYLHINDSVELEFDSTSDAIKFITQFNLEIDLSYLKDKEQRAREELAKISNLLYRLS